MAGELVGQVRAELSADRAAVGAHLPRLHRDVVAQLGWLTGRGTGALASRRVLSKLGGVHVAEQVDADPGIPTVARA